MPVITVYRHGGSGGIAPMKNDHDRALRGEVSGWSESATRRNTRFLYSIQEDQLEGAGMALTLTLRDCPPSAQHFHKMRRAWEKRMVRAGMIRLHWVIEWQRRGVPHLHGAIWFPDSYDRFRIVDAWCAVAADYECKPQAQFVRPVEGVIGWFQYLAKHASRGVLHYQRAAANMPQEWRGKTGRMWGKVGDWPVRPAVKLNLEDQHGDGGWFAYRRLIRSWRVADARASGSRYRITSARKMLRERDPVISRLRGVSEWIPESVHMTLIANLAERGFRVRS
jgi:hypothetical protein